MVLAFLSRLHPVVKGLVIYWLLTSLAGALPLPARPRWRTRSSGPRWCWRCGPRRSPGATSRPSSEASRPPRITIWLYLGHALEALGQTVYPGRRFSGGGGVDYLRWLSQFFPTVQVDHHRLLNPGNICEQAMMGTFYVLLVVCFLDYRGLVQAEPGHPPGRARPAGRVPDDAGLAAPAAALVGGRAVPVAPRDAGPAQRRAPACCACSTAAIAARRGRLRATWPRFAVFAALVLVVWYRYKRQVGWNGWIDVAILAARGLRRLPRPHAAAGTSPRLNRALLASAAVVGLLAFGDFNPVQSTRPIFARPNTWMTRALDQRLKDGCTTFVIPFEWSFFGHTGSPLVGLGYPSLAHATFEPRLAYWRSLFPELPPDQFNQLFNNVGVFVAGDTERPRRIPGTLATEVPIRTVLERGSGYPCLFSGARRDLGAGAYAVRWELPPLPAQVPRRRLLRMPVKVTNIGNDIWPDREMADAGEPGGWAVRLTYRWRTPSQGRPAPRTLRPEATRLPRDDRHHPWRCRRHRRARRLHARARPPAGERGLLQRPGRAPGADTDRGGRRRRNRAPVAAAESDTGRRNWHSDWAETGKRLSGRICTCWPAMVTFIPKRKMPGSLPD